MAIDPYIALQGRPIQVDQPVDVATKVLGLREMQMRAEQMSRGMADQQALNAAYRAAYTPDQAAAASATPQSAQTPIVPSSAPMPAVGPGAPVPKTPWQGVNFGGPQTSPSALGVNLGGAPMPSGQPAAPTAAESQPPKLVALNKDAITRTLAAQGRGHLIPGVLTTLTDLEEKQAKLGESKAKVAEHEANYVGGIGRAVKAAGYDPQFAIAMLGDAVQRGYTSAIPLIQAIQKDPSIVQRLADSAILRSKEASQEQSAAETSAARKTTADAAAAREKQWNEFEQQRLALEKRRVDLQATRDKAMGRSEDAQMRKQDFEEYKGFRADWDKSETSRVSKSLELNPNADAGFKLPPTFDQWRAEVHDRGPLPKTAQPLLEGGRNARTPTPTQDALDYQRLLDQRGSGSATPAPAPGPVATAPAQSTAPNPAAPVQRAAVPPKAGTPAAKALRQQIQPGATVTLRDGRKVKVKAVNPDGTIIPE